MNKYKNKKEEILQIIMFIMPQFLYTIYICMTGRIRFATNDDIVIVDILSGRYGKFSPYVSGISVVFGYIQNYLFKLLPYVNWTALTYLFLICASFLVIDVVMVKEKSSLFELLIKAFLLFDSFFLFINHFTFTIAANAGCMAGMVWAIYNLKREDILFQKRNIAPGFLICAGMLIRPSVIQSFIFVLMLYAVYELIKARKKGLIILCICVYAGMYVISGINNYACSQSPIQQEYNEWNSARSGVTDRFEKEELKNVLDWTENDYDALYNVFLYDKELFSKQNLRKLREENKSIQYLENFKHIFSDNKGILKVTSNQEFYYNHFAKMLFVFLLCAIIGDKRKRKEYLTVAAGAISLSILFFIMGRSVYRVIMPGYIFATLLFFMIAEFKTEKLKKSWKSLAIGIVVLFSIFLGKTQLKNLEYWSGVYDERNEKVIDYLEQNQDILYIPCNSNAFALSMAEPLFKYTGYKKKNMIGNWEIYSEPYYQLMKSYNIKHPDQLVKDIPDNENLQLVTIGKEVPEFALKFIEERNGCKIETKLEYTIEDTAYGEWNFYSVQKKVKENL